MRSYHRLFIKLAAIVISAVSLSLCVSIAGAQPTDKTARQLFEDGIGRMSTGDFVKAADLLEESLKREPNIATQFRLGECREKLNQLASAHKIFNAVAKHAEQIGNTGQSEYARQRAMAIANSIPRLNVILPPNVPVQSITLHVDRAPRPLNRPLMVDAGPHQLSLTSPGAKPWQTTVTAKNGTTLDVRVPSTWPATPPPSRQPTPASPAQSDQVSKRDPFNPPPPQAIEGLSTPQAIAVGLGAGGIALMGAGLGFGLAAKSIADHSLLHCNEDGSLCSPGAITAQQDAVRLGNVGSGLTIAGGVVAAAGITTWVVEAVTDAPSDERAAVSISVGPTSFFVRGSF